MLGLYVLGTALARQNPFPAAVQSVLPGIVTSSIVGGLIIRGMARDRGSFVALFTFPLIAFLIPGFEWAAGLRPVSGFFALSPHLDRFANVISPFHPPAPVWYVPVSVGAAAALLVFVRQFAALRGKTAGPPQYMEPALPYELDFEPA